MKRSLRTVALLSLALLVGASCSNPSLGVDLPTTPATIVAIDDGIYTYPAIAKVQVTDGAAPQCSVLKIGAVVRKRCFDHESPPVMAYAESATRLLIVGVNGGDAVAFVDGIRVLSRSRHFVAAQMSAGMSLEDVRFTVQSDTSIMWCDVGHHLLMTCTGLSNNA
ncbi:MAG: hypothetical protein ABI706_15570 [Ilumatobacteraceae bacterium]